MTLKQLLQILWARRRLFAILFFTVVALGALVTAIWPKTYLAEVSVVIDSKGTDAVSGQEQAADLLASTMGTQVDVITSHNVALKVVDKLRLTSIPNLQDSYREATDGVGSIRDWIADRLVKSLQVQPSKDSHVINIDVIFNDPTFAADLANAFADAYIQTSLELKMDPSKRQARWFEEQLASLRKSLETSQAQLSEYQRANSVAGTNDQIDIENARLAEISNQLLAAQAAMYDRQTRLKQMNQALQRGELKELPDLLGNGLLQELKAQLVQSESNLAQLAERFGKNHPQYLSAVAQTSALRDKLAAEVNTAKGAITQAAEISVRQEGELRQAMQRQRDRILELKHQRDELDVLKHEVEDRQRAYDAGLQRTNQIHLESQLDQSNIAVLNPAFPPIFPARPKPLLNMALAILLGVIFGVSAVVSAEAADRRVRTTNDLLELPGVVVLAEIPKAVFTREQRKHLRRADKPLLLKLQES